MNLIQPLQRWQRVFRLGIAPAIPTAALIELRAALAADDPKIIQGAVTSPAPLDSLRSVAVHGSDVIGFAAMVGFGLRTVGEVVAHYHAVCEAADVSLRESHACRWFLVWYDETPRDAMRAALMAEIDAVLVDRCQPAAAAA